jgi:uncharacterized protein YlxW (UPF0749 family)
MHSCSCIIAFVYHSFNYSCFVSSPVPAVALALACSAVCMEEKLRRRRALACLTPHVRQVSNAAMVDILNTIRKHSEVLDDEVAVTRQQLDRSVEEHIRVVERTLSLPAVKGNGVQVTICDIGLLLHHLVSNRQGLQAVYASAIAAKPPSMENPWSLVVAFDEFTPGAQLTGKHLRKVIHVFLF